MPYAPGVQDIRGQLLMQGAAGFGRGLEQAGNAISSAIEAHKRVLANAKASEIIFDNNPEIQEMYSGTPEQFKALSAQDKANFMQGAISNYHIQQAALQQKESKVNLAYRQQQLSDLQTQGPAQTRFYEDIAKYGQTDAAPQFNQEGFQQSFDPQSLSQAITPDALQQYGAQGTLPRVISPELLQQYSQPIGLPQIAGAAARSGYRLRPGEIDDVLRGAAAAAPGGTPQFVEDPVSGSRFVRQKNTLMPSGMNPAIGLQTEQATLADGTVADFVRNPRTGALIQARAPNLAQQRKLGVDALLEAEKGMQNLDLEINAYHNRLERSKTDKNVKPYPESRLQDLERRRARLEKILSTADEEATVGPPRQGVTPRAPQGRTNQLQGPITEIQEPPARSALSRVPPENQNAVAQLQSDLRAKRISPAQFKAKLKELGIE